MEREELNFSKGKDFYYLISFFIFIIFYLLLLFFLSWYFGLLCFFFFFIVLFCSLSSTFTSLPYLELILSRLPLEDTYPKGTIRVVNLSKYTVSSFNKRFRHEDFVIQTGNVTVREWSKRHQFPIVVKSRVSGEILLHLNFTMKFCYSCVFICKPVPFRSKERCKSEHLKLF